MELRLLFQFAFSDKERFQTTSGWWLLLAHTRSRARINRRVCLFSLSSIVLFLFRCLEKSSISECLKNRKEKKNNNCDFSCNVPLSCLFLGDNACWCKQSPPIKIFEKVHRCDIWRDNPWPMNCLLVWRTLLEFGPWFCHRNRPSQKCRDRTRRAILWVYRIVIICAETNPTQLCTQPTC